MLRSYLYVPADQPARLAKAVGLIGRDRPDALIVDLEDAVALSRKDEARAMLCEALRTGAVPASAIVRINSGDVGRDDIAALAEFPPRTLLVPKATATSLAAVDADLHKRGLGHRLAALVESADGLHDVDAIAASPRLVSMAIGEADLCAELGIDPAAEWALWPLRMRLVVASARAGIVPPTGPVSVDFRDLEALASSSRALRHAGFGARSAIHPAQVSTIRDAFEPSGEQLSAARALVDRYDAALADGRGAIVDDNGRMLDEAVVRAARRLLS